MQFAVTRGLKERNCRSLTELCQNCGKVYRVIQEERSICSECDRVGHCKKMCSCELLCNAECLPSRPVCMYKCKIVVKGNKER